MFRALHPVTPLDRGRVRLGDREFTNFSSNDYLGLSQHPLLIERAREWTACWGAGAGASRLVTGSFDAFRAVEEKIARLKGTEAALVFVSGWQANACVLPALFHRETLGEAPLVFSDRLNHASLHQGCLAAGIRQIRFRHSDLGHLEALLVQHRDKPGKRFIVTESVFSMDGDRTDIIALCDLADRFDAFLYLDEAHATGVLGPKGAGLSGLAPGRVDAVMGTFSKALGGFGAYVAGSRALCDHLVNHASGLIFATALPPSVWGAIDAALDLVPTLDAERARLARHGARLRAALSTLGYDTCGSTTQIVPAVIGEAAAALEASEALKGRGILAVAIRPPTVPAGSSRIRFALSAAHDEADIDHLAAAMAEIVGRPVS
jgi:8-amino-7-oxononanoate synthase